MPTTNPAQNSRVKYRSSCDRCQDNKVKCGQEKPECERCVKKRLMCVYSPIRTMGRPRKAQPGPGTSTAANSRHVATSLPPVANVDVMQGIEEDHPRHLNPQDPETENINPGLDQGPINLDTPPMSYPSPSTNGTRTTSRGSTNGDFSNATGITAPSITSGPSPLSSCYTSILSRSLKLEQILLSAAGDPIGLEAALEAESDFRALKTQLFSCPGGSHIQNENLPKHVTAITGTSFILTPLNPASAGANKPPCLSSLIESRLCLTTLVVYAERVAEVLKDAIADFQPFPGVDSCSTRCSYFGVQNYRVLRVMDFHALRVDGFFLDQGSERVNRLWDLDSVREQLAVAVSSRGGCKGDVGGRTDMEIVTAPERKQTDDDAEREIERQQGNGYENRNFGSMTPAEGRALRRIFRLRMQKFRRALVDIHRFVKPPSPHSAADGQGQGKEDHDHMMVAMALAFVEPMVDNLVRRVEVMEQVMAGTLE